ncbi:MAG TPA: hypothetical protein DDZ88_14435 [Verrucomicrobiales bacterium]|nr:hypothetical protein [Verrucomicrobiales bacterium]
MTTPNTWDILPSLAEMQALLERDPATLSADEKRRPLNLQRQHAEVLGLLPPVCYDLEKMRKAPVQNATNVEPFEIMDGLYYVGNSQLAGLNAP